MKPTHLRGKNPIPNRHPRWIDNYVSEFGFYHSEAVNIALQKANAFVHLVEGHSYPQYWYQKSIDRAVDLNDDTELGFRRSWERNLLPGRFPLTFPPPELSIGEAYRQKPDSTDILEMEILPDRNGFQILFPFLGRPLNFVVNGTETIAENVLGGTVAAARVVGNATVSVAERTGIAVNNGINTIVDQAINGDQSVLDLLNRQSLSIRLITGILPGNLRRANASGENENTNSQPLIWLPIEVPSNAAVMAFDFSIEGDPVDDLLVCGIGDTNLFSLEAKFIPTNAISASRLIDVSGWAGTTNELFFGFMAGLQPTPRSSLKTSASSRWQNRDWKSSLAAA